MSSGGGAPDGSGCSPSSAAKDHCFVLSEILWHIYEYYKAALDRLPVEEMPALIPRLLGAGVCFGLLDPVSNIIANTLFSIMLGRRGLSGPRTVARRSLEGLVTFLICYFRQLPVSEALHYLLLAKADLLAAVHLIEHNRGMAARLFPISSPTTEISLKCAAMSASHPDPVLFAARSLSLASRLEQHLTLRNLCGKQFFLLRLNRYIRGTNSLSKFPLEFTETLRTLLLEKIHVLYLRAIARLPRDDLRGRYHHGLLKAGHCFGPANAPVTNIILNTIWYDTAFPPHEEFKVDMICTSSLVRIECRSLNGLLAFLHNLFPTLSEHDALLQGTEYELHIICGWCFHCEYEGIKIVHPDFGTYRGRETDFEEMACGKRKVDNEELIGFGDMRMEFVGMVSDDSVYSDPATDSDFADSWQNHTSSSARLSYGLRFIMFVYNCA
uniref:PIR2-like helical domain-containing protein n=1 Tax=Setaria italica TaxID=4555 RepID=K4AL21_SETIT